MGAVCVGASKPQGGMDVERVSELSRSMESLHSVICRYDSLVGRLGNRLQPALRQSTSVCAETEKDAGYETELANRVNSMRCTLRDITNCLEDIVERIEL